MRRKLTIALTQFATITGIFMFLLGIEWMKGGHGFHPLAAFPLGTICLLIPFTWTREWG